jgi:hypothetical protein
MNVHADAFKKKAQAYQNELAAQQKAGKTPKPDREREVKMLTELKAKVLSEMSATQIKRLREISLQAVGVTALGDDAVAARVGLSADQKAKIRKLVGAGLEKANGLAKQANDRAAKGLKEPKTQKEVEAWQKEFGTRLAAEQKKLQPQLESIRKSTITQVLALLNEKQKNAWKALLGPTFK